MIRALLERLRQKHRTVAYPARPPSIPERYRGAPELAPEKCAAGCAACAAACPVGAIELAPGAIRLDLGKCLFCGDCAAACPPGAIRFTRDPRVAARRRSELVAGTAERRLAAALDGKMKRLIGRSLKLRQVCAGGCGACEADTNVLSTVVFDLGRFGIQFVASPRHADGLLITGPVTENMALALKKPTTPCRSRGCDRGRRVRDFGRSLRRPCRGAQRRGRRRAGGSVYSRLSAAPRGDSRRLLRLLGRLDESR
jgi:formate hydrogenlyase subunit 6/NADH:ubiquinone oxidoreductase subunit I